jgi:hypothetical protein
MCNLKVSKFFMCEKRPSSASHGFITRMFTCPAPSQFCIFKVV